MNKSVIKNPQGHWFIVPDGKEISCVEYTDGTADILVDLDYLTMSVLYLEAHKLQCTPEEVAVKALEKYIKILDKKTSKKKRKLTG